MPLRLKAGPVPVSLPIAKYPTPTERFLLRGPNVTLPKTIVKKALPSPIIPPMVAPAPTFTTSFANGKVTLGVIHTDIPVLLEEDLVEKTVIPKLKL